MSGTVPVKLVESKILVWTLKRRGSGGEVEGKWRGRSWSEVEGNLVESKVLVWTRKWRGSGGEVDGKWRRKWMRSGGGSGG